MAYTDNDSPSEVFGTGYSSDGSSITFTIGSTGLLTNLTSAEANATTGDYRHVIYELLNFFFTEFNAVPTADTPTQMSITRSRTESGGVLRTRINASFNMEASSLSVLDEPTS